MKFKDYIHIIIVLGISFVIILFAGMGLKVPGEVRSLQNDIESYKQITIKNDKMMNKRIEVLEMALNNQFIINEQLKLQAQENLDGVNYNTSRVVRNAADIDTTSHESCETHRDDIWDELNYLRKMVK